MGEELDPDIRKLCESYAHRLADGHDDLDDMLSPFDGLRREKLRALLLDERERRSIELGETLILDSIAEDVSATPVPNTAGSLRLFTNPSLRCLSSDAIRALAAKLSTRRFNDGEFLLRQGQLGSQMFILVAGSAAIRLSHANETTTIDNCQAGDILGEMSFLTKSPCTANVQASGSVETLVLSKEHFEELKTEYPELEIALSQVISKRLGIHATDALTGKWIEHYYLRRCINRGGMAVVYEAADDQGRVVALKMLHHRFLRRQDIIDSFLQEGRILSKLTHPNIVRVLDCFVALNTRFLVMDYWGGEDLAAILKRHGPVSEEVCRSILGQLSAALSFAHQHGILHLDIKPANVLLARDGRVGLADFGLCGLLGKSEETGAIVGSLPYMPPEQFSSGKLTAAVDWYALACTAVELLTGERLFKETSVSGFRLAKQRSIPAPFWPTYEASDELKEIIAGALQPEPTLRRLDLDRLGKWSRPVPELLA